MRMSTTTVALIVLICTLLFGGVIVSRSYLEGFDVDKNGNTIPSPNTPTNDPPPIQYAAPLGQPMMPPQGQPMMPPQGQPMMPPQGQPMMPPQGQPMMMDTQPTLVYSSQGIPGQMAPQPMRQRVPLMPPMALPMDAHIMLPIQSPIFARSRVHNSQMGAPYQPPPPMLNPGEQVGPTPVMQQHIVTESG